MVFILLTRDKTGKLALSPKQKAIFSRWVRPDEISNNPTMIMSVSSFSIKQVRSAASVSDSVHVFIFMAGFDCKLPPDFIDVVMISFSVVLVEDLGSSILVFSFICVFFYTVRPLYPEYIMWTVYLSVWLFILYPLNSLDVLTCLNSASRGRCIITHKDHVKTSFASDAEYKHAALRFKYIWTVSLFWFAYKCIFVLVIAQ